MLTAHTSQLKAPGRDSQLASSQSTQTLTHRPSGSQGAKQSSVSAKLAERRAKLLEPVRANPNRARQHGAPNSYTVAPVSSNLGAAPQDHRPVGASGVEAFRRMTTKGKKRS